jgi:hypothetical protein
MIVLHVQFDIFASCKVSEYNLWNFKQCDINFIKLWCQLLFLHENISCAMFIMINLKYFGKYLSL